MGCHSDGCPVFPACIVILMSPLIVREKLLSMSIRTTQSIFQVELISQNG